MAEEYYEPGKTQVPRETVLQSSGAGAAYGKPVQQPKTPTPEAHAAERTMLLQKIGIVIVVAIAILVVVELYHPLNFTYSISFYSLPARIGSSFVYKNSTDVTNLLKSSNGAAVIKNSFIAVGQAVYVNASSENSSEDILVLYKYLFVNGSVASSAFRNSSLQDYASTVGATANSIVLPDNVIGSYLVIPPHPEYISGNPVYIQYQNGTQVQAMTSPIYMLEVQSLYRNTVSIASHLRVGAGFNVTDDAGILAQVLSIANNDIVITSRSSPATTTSNTKAQASTNGTISTSTTAPTAPTAASSSNSQLTSATVSSTTSIPHPTSAVTSAVSTTESTSITPSTSTSTSSATTTIKAATVTISTNNASAGEVQAYVYANGILECDATFSCAAKTESIECPLGATLTIQAVPGAGGCGSSNASVSWACTGPGCYSGSNAEASFILTGDVSETATFH